MKKTFAVILAAMMLVVAFAGCAKKTEEPATSPAATEEVAPATTETAPETTTEAPATSEAPVESPAASTATNG